MSLRADNNLRTRQEAEINRQQEINRQREIRDRAAAPASNPAPNSRLGENRLFGDLQRNALERNLLTADFRRPPTDVQPPAPQTVFEAQTQIKNLPVPDLKDAPGIQTYNQKRAEIADAGIANSKPPMISDFDGLNGATRSYEYREAKTAYDQGIAQLRETSATAKAKPFELPLTAALTPYQAVERINQIPVPDAKNAPALKDYINQTQTIAQSSLAQAQPPKRSDFNGLPPQIANLEYRDALQSYSQATGELKPFADGISYVRSDQTVDYMFGEMKGNLNSPEFKFIKDSLDLAADPPLFSGPNATTGYLTAALTKFALQVRSNGPWDHKPILKEKLGLVTSKDQGLPIDQSFPIRGDAQHEVNYDIWSNIHYGYIGRAAGFDQGTLQTAPALAIPGVTGGNDPVDVVTTQIGIDLWNKYGANLTKEQFESEIQTRIPQIIAAQQTPEYIEKNGDFRHVTDINQTNRR